MAVVPLQSSYLSAMVVGLAGLLLIYLYDVLWRRPEKIWRVLRRQGIAGPPPSFLFGNIREMRDVDEPEKVVARGDDNGLVHNYWSTLFPYFLSWRKIYGSTFMFSTGNTVSLYVSDAEMVKELCRNKSLDIGKATLLLNKLDALFGNGVLVSSGHSWAAQRKIIAPELFADKVKGMVDLMVKSATVLLKSWEARLDRVGSVAAADMKVDADLRRFAVDVLGKACFGIDCTADEEIFQKVLSIQKCLTTQNIVTSVPGSRFLPTATNRFLWKTGSEIKCLLLSAVKERKKGLRSEKDLLQIMIRSENDRTLPKSFVVDNCKTLYNAGEGATGMTAMWALLLLAYCPEWQTRVRAEVMDVCRGCVPNAKMLEKMTLLTQVIQETLRLYPQGVLLLRQARRDVSIGGLHVPKGTCLWITPVHLHYDTALWGADADRFNPERFSDGVSGACKHPHMYLPFGFGPWVCPGQGFAMTELKVVLSMVLARYKVSPSPNYRHSVVSRVLIEPRHGLQLVVERV